MASTTRVPNRKPATSSQASTREMLDFAAGHGLATVFDRFDGMQPQCHFGREGLCCNLCSMGPCRLNGTKTGVCGASADTIIARNLLRQVTAGASIYLYEGELAAKTLRAAAEPDAMLPVRDEAKLRALALGFGLDAGQPLDRVAADVAGAFIADLHGDRDTPARFMQTQATGGMRERWTKAGILPGGALVELRDALAKSASSVDSDPNSLILTALRLSIATGFSGLLATNVMNDVILGTPSLSESPVDLGILEPATVNIVAHGHDPYVATAVLQLLRDDTVQARARAVGAAGIRLYGSACVGQELLQRASGTAQGVAGLVGNCLGQEAMIATGLVDLVMLDLNCTHPGMQTTADRFHTRLVPVSHLVNLEGNHDRVDYTPAGLRQQATRLVDLAIEAFSRRNGEGHQPTQRGTAVSGFCAESITAALGGSLAPLVDAIGAGGIRGIVAVVGCTTVRCGHGTNALALTRELLSRDILVINSGCCSGTTQLAGLMVPSAASEASPRLRAVCEALGIPPCLNFGACTDIGRIAQTVLTLARALGVEPADLPVAASAPEYLDQKALCDGFFAVALGLLTHVAPVPPVGNNHAATFMLTTGLEAITGGRFLAEPDPARAAAAIDRHIGMKRKALGMD